MPIQVPDALPAVDILQDEGIRVIPNSRAFSQDIRPLRIAILNIMPSKVTTETQLLRLLGSSPLQIQVTFLYPSSHVSKNTQSQHLEKFYRTFEDVKDSRFDCLIITGAPVGSLDFDQVDYWTELTEVMDWSVSNVYSTLYLCWGAHAGLYHHYNIPKYPLAKKLFGVFYHTRAESNSPLLYGFDDVFQVPHSRYSEVRYGDIEKVSSLKILAYSERAGVYAVSTHDNRLVFITGHPEYDTETLGEEYDRDVQKGLATTFPRNYYQDDIVGGVVSTSWRSHAFLLMNNWLNDVYQNVPFDLETMTPQS